MTAASAGLSRELTEILALVPPDFADYRVVRAMMAPFHGHPVPPHVSVTESVLGGVRCAWYDDRSPRQERVAFHCHEDGLAAYRGLLSAGWRRNGLWSAATPAAGCSGSTRYVRASWPWRRRHCEPGSRSPWSRGPAWWQGLVSAGVPEVLAWFARARQYLDGAVASPG